MVELAQITRFGVKILEVVVPLWLIGLEIILNIIAFTSVCNGVIFLLFITSPLVMILFAFWWPMFICVALLLKFTSVKSYSANLVLNTITHFMFHYKGKQRKYLWKTLYKFLSLNLPNYITLQNSGYALLSASGRAYTFDSQKKLVGENKKDNLFQLQLYHQVALNAPSLQSLKNLRVLDLACGRGGGLAFLAEQFDPKVCVGIDMCGRQVQFARDSNKDFSGCRLDFLEGDAEDPEACLTDKQESFDLALCIEAWHQFPSTQSVLRETHKLLTRNISAVGVSNLQNQSPSSAPASPSPLALPRFLIADSFYTSDVEKVEQEMQECFNIKKKIDCTLNVMHAKHLDFERTQCLLDQAYRDFISRYFFSLSQRDEETRSGEDKKYLVYELVPKMA